MAKQKKNRKKAQEIKESSAKKVTSNSPAFPSYFTNKKLICLKLFLVSCLIYAGTLTHQFTQDDAIVITDNDFTKKGFSGIKELLQYDTFRGFFKVEGKDNLVEGGRYRPLTPIMFAVGIQLFGENPFMFHLMNVLWYGLTVVLLFIILLKLLNTSKPESYVYFVAFATAMLFALHPIHTEVVSNVKGRDEIMTLFLSLSAIWFSLKAVDEGERIKNWIFVFVIFFLALLAKEMAIVFVPIVAISIYIFRGKTILESLTQMAPYIICFGLYMVLRIRLGIPLIGGEPSGELMNNPFLGLNSGQKFATIFYTLGKYLQLLVIPHPLTHDYYPRAIAVKTFADPAVILSVLSYVGLIGYGIWGVLKRNHIAYGIAFFLTSLFLVSNIPVNIGANMAERFLFIPSIGFCFIVAILLYRLAKKMNNGKEITAYKQFKPALIVLAIFFTGFAIKTVTRSLVWKSNYSLFATDWNKYPDSAKVRNAIGGELSVRSQDEGIKGTPKEKEMLKESVMHLTHALKIHPTYKGAYLLRGNSNFYLGNYKEAISNYQTALNMDPSFVDAQDNLSKAIEMQKQSGLDDLENKAIEASNQKNYPEAIRLFTELVQKQNDNPKYYFFLGTAHGMSGNNEAALSNLLKAEQLNKDPDNIARIIGAIIATYNNLGDTENAALYQAKLGQ